MAVAILVACGQTTPDVPPKPAGAKFAERMAKASALAAAQSARSRSVVVGASEVVVIDVPTAGSPHSVSYQTCYVYRDHEFKTSTMSCPSGDTVDLPVNDEVAPQER